ncbi:hypothetical protein TNCV_2546141 [Trichonephila clavipes]|nr:hypothetical protein TNCV_2546141 [Trichonephila clavipes]
MACEFATVSFPVVHCVQRATFPVPSLVAFQDDENRFGLRKQRIIDTSLSKTASFLFLPSNGGEVQRQIKAENVRLAFHR